MVGIDMFGYGEKHPVSNAVIQYGGSINEMLGIDWGEGAWLFALVKAALVGLIVWLFVQMRVEQRQQHFRLLHRSRRAHRRLGSGAFRTSVD